MKLKHESKIQNVPIDRITVVNSRTRGQVKFKQIVANIANIGLKKPITVARREGKDGQIRYELVCGEGRLLALKALGQTEVPVLIVEGSKEDLLLSGLAENVARRQYTTIEAARQIAAMKDRGDKPAEIAKKVDLDVTYVNGILRLLKNGEERLLVAVEKRQLPLSVAIAICGSSDQDVQRAMTEAYERGELRGKALLRAKRLIDQRRTRGKGRRGPANKSEGVTVTTLVKAYKKETARQQMALGRARLCETRLRFVVSAVKKMLADESLVNLLRAEGLATLPQPLAEQIQNPGVALG
jgi:ParB family transcriptional regulator, chromosome partitioning protein